VIVAGEEVERGKPAPDIYLRAADKLGLTADACLVVEDALPGVAAAKAAKMRVVAIPDRRFVDPREYDKKADYVLGSLKELPTLIFRLNRNDSSVIANGYFRRTAAWPCLAPPAKRTRWQPKSDRRYSIPCLRPASIRPA